MKFKIKLIDIGRNKVNQEYEQKADNLDEIANLTYCKIRNFLLSSEVCLEPDNKNEELWNVVVGGFRNVGQVIIKEVTK